MGAKVRKKRKSPKLSRLFLAFKRYFLLTLLFALVRLRQRSLDACLLEGGQQLFGRDGLMMILHGQRLAQAVDIGVLNTLDGLCLDNGLRSCLLCGNQEVSVGALSTTTSLDGGIAHLGHNGANAVGSHLVAVEVDGDVVTTDVGIHAVDARLGQQSALDAVGALLAVHVVNMQHSGLLFS